MSDGRKRKSGARYKKLREEHEEKEKRVIQKIRKLDTICLGNGSSKFGTDGYDDWNNVHSGLTSHENSSEHVQSSSTFLNRSKFKNRIDKGLQLQIQN